MDYDLILLDMPGMTGAAAMGGRVPKSFQWDCRDTNGLFVDGLLATRKLTTTGATVPCTLFACTPLKQKSSTIPGPNSYLSKNEGWMVTRLFYRTTTHPLCAGCHMTTSTRPPSLQAKVHRRLGISSFILNSNSKVDLHLMKAPATFGQAFVQMATVNCWDSRM
jgi:hypothetical protein